MPFVYFGGKKQLARHYPPPAEGVIIEPFAGSAGYSLHWATPAHEVVLIEKDPAVVALWRRLQAPDAAEDILSIRTPLRGNRSAEPFVATCAGGGASVGQSFRGESFPVTDRMERQWPYMQVRLVRAIPTIRSWTVIEGDCTDAPDVRATWFIDPPYWVPDGAAGSRGDGYRHGASAIDFAALAAWCQTRHPQVIVCEQDGATWLPFRPLVHMQTGDPNGGTRRLEVVWTRTPGSMVATPRARQSASAASARRSARMRDA